MPLVAAWIGGSSSGKCRASQVREEAKKELSLVVTGATLVVNKCLTSSNKKLLVTSASLLVTSALLVVTRS